MPTVSGKDLISESTEKSQLRLMIVSSIAIITKAYAVPSHDLRLLGVEVPAPAFDVTLFVLVLWAFYTFLLKWIGDLAAFRLWFRESSIWSEFGTNMKLDKSFISGGISLLKEIQKLELEKQGGQPVSELPEDVKKQFEDFRTNVELYGARLEYAGTRFSALSFYAHFYVWIQSFFIPLLWGLAAIYLLLKYGNLSPPPKL
jgi:hypothetical protein